MLKEQNSLTGDRNSPVFLESGQGNFKPGSDPELDNLSEGVDENWHFGDAISGES